MSALAAQAGMSLQLVEEVAADIFTGTFTGKRARAAATASNLLDRTPYARYYHLPTPHAQAGSLGGFAVRVTQPWGRTTPRTSPRYAPPAPARGKPTAGPAALSR